MRQKLITLDDETAKMAQKKTNFSEWVRNQLRSERTKSEVRDVIAQLEKDIIIAEERADYWYELYFEQKVKK
jgi:vacuolar-type H+-ATPase subunit I/STV1